MSRYRKSMAEAYLKVRLGEDNMDLMKKAAGGAMQTLKMKDGKLKMDSFTASAIMAIYKAVNPKNKKTMENLINTGNKAAILKLQKFAMSKIKSGDEVEHDGDNLKEHHQKDAEGNIIVHDTDDEEVSEGRMKELHGYIEAGKTAEWIAKKMKLDVKTVKALMSEAIDPADVDHDATDDDVKSADKNIIMQMRKVVSLRGNFKVEFRDGKKQKIDTRIALAVQDKFSKLRKPDDKEKFMNKVAKSYKDMLSALKESLDEGYSKKEIKMAIGIASDPRYKQGNYSGAVKAIEKIKKGLSQEKQVAAVLKRQNEEVELDEDLKVAHKVKAKDGGYFVILHRDTKGMSGKQDKFIMRHIKGGKVTDYGSHVSVDGALKFAKNKNIIEEIELNEVFDFVLLDKDNKIVGRHTGKDAKKNAEFQKKSAHLAPMSASKSDIKKMKIVPISPKDKKDIGDTVLAIGEDMTVTGSTDGSISQRDLDHVQKELRKLGIKDAVVDQNEMDKNKIDVKTKMSDDKVKKAFDKSKMTVTYEHVQMEGPPGTGTDALGKNKKAAAAVYAFAKSKKAVKEGTWALPDTPKLKAGLKKLMKKPIPLGKDGDAAVDAIGKYIGDDGLYDDLYDAGKKDGPKADARPVIRGWMDREFVDSWKKYRIETTTILDRIDKKLKERRNG